MSMSKYWHSFADILKNLTALQTGTRQNNSGEAIRGMQIMEKKKEKENWSIASLGLSCKLNRYIKNSLLFLYYPL